MLRAGAGRSQRRLVQRDVEDIDRAATIPGRALSTLTRSVVLGDASVEALPTMTPYGRIRLLMAEIQQACLNDQTSGPVLVPCVTQAVLSDDI